MCCMCCHTSGNCYFGRHRSGSGEFCSNGQHAQLPSSCGLAGTGTSDVTYDERDSSHVDHLSRDSFQYSSACWQPKESLESSLSRITRIPSCGKEIRTA